MTKTITGLFPLEGASTGKRSPSFQTKGYVGASCAEATKTFEAALGTVVSDEATPEMYQTEEPREYLNNGE